MRSWTIAAAAALSVMAGVAQADSMDRAVEPALMFKLDFGGRSTPVTGMALRLNYSSDLRQALGLRLAHADTLQQRMQVAGQSHLFSLPAVAQFDFDQAGFNSASAFGQSLVTRQLRLNQAEGAAESASWFDFSTANWTAWAMAGAGAVGIYLLTEDDDGDSAPVGGSGNPAPTPEEEEPTEEICVDPLGLLCV